MVEAFDYDEARADADELIQEFGRLAAIRRFTASGDEQEPTRTPADTATRAVRVEFTLRQLQGGNIGAKDQRWLIAAGPLAGLVPGPDDFLVVNGESLTIIKVSPLDPAGTPVLYDAQVSV